MAEAYGKLTGRPGVCLVTRGPGATHASVGVHTAFQDSTPMLLLVGQVARGTSGREGFQELDYRQVFGRVAKWATQVDDAARLPEVRPRVLGRVLGRPGPVVVALPEDMLDDETDVADARPRARRGAAPGAAELERLRDLLARRRAAAGDRRRGRLDARRPAPTSSPSPRRRRSRSRVLPLPGLRRQRRRGLRRARRHRDGPALAQRIADADVLLAVGGRLGDIPSAGYTLLDIPRPRQRSSTCTPTRTSSARSTSPSCRSCRGARAFAAALRARCRGASRRGALARRPAPSTRQPARAPRAARATLAARRGHGRAARAPAADAILTCGAGNFTVWAHRFYAFRQLRHASSRRAAARWATASRRRSRRRRVASRARPSSASRATATS